MLGQIKTESVGIHASMGLLDKRIIELMDQITYLDEAVKQISITPIGASGIGSAIDPQENKSDSRIIIDEFINAITIAAERVMKIRCNLDL